VQYKLPLCLYVRLQYKLLESLIKRLLLAVPRVCLTTCDEETTVRRKPRPFLSCAFSVPLGVLPMAPSEYKASIDESRCRAILISTFSLVGALLLSP
jgi:hypothetical protein